MNALVVYDSLYGNTERIARAIGDALVDKAGDKARVVRPGGMDADDVEAVDLLVIGSPTHGGRPTEAIQGLLDGLEGTLPADTRVAAFDTRMATRLVAIFGYAARRIGRALEEAGGTLVAPPEGFVVKGKEGPLKDGELERAADWAKGLLGSSSGEGEA
ncbi:MAG: flavodoxin family protein [Chloroflexota bacterium]